MLSGKKLLLLLLAIVLLQFLGSRVINKAGKDLIQTFERERKSRAIAIIHSHESVGILGVPIRKFS